MRHLLPNLGLGASSARGITSSGMNSRTTLFSSARRPLLSQRHVHPTLPADILRRRSFFTSNILMQQNGSDPPAREPKAGKSTDDNPATKPANPANKKRKPPLKNSLHRVAIVAQKGVPVKKPPPAAESVPGAEGSSTVSAVCVAETFDMDRVEDILKHHGFLIDPDGNGFESHEVVHARGFNTGDIFVFPSGTVVTWGLPPDIVNSLATKHLLPAAETPFIEEKEEEDLEFLVDPEQEESRVTGDVVVLGTRREVVAGDRLETTLAKIAFSSGLARSTKLAVLESSLTRYLESTRNIPDRLSQGLSAPLSRGMILQKAGELLNLRSQLNHYNDLTDALPDIFWDTEEKLETYYAKIGKALDVGVRIKTLNDKMTYAQEVVTVAQGVLDISEKMSSEAHSTRLEWIIIVLIAIEVVFELRRLYIERYDHFHTELLAELRALRAEIGSQQGQQSKTKDRE